MVVLSKFSRNSTSYCRSCQIFQEFSNSLAHIVKFRTNMELDWYLDDYFFVSLLRTNCNWQVTVFLNICEQINFPVSEDKTEWATQEIVFLGLLLNTIMQMVTIPEAKRLKALEAIDIILRAKKVKVLQLQKLTGQLNFLCKAIVPGRAFTRRMYAKFKSMKQHHHVRVDSELKADCLMWTKFLLNTGSVSRPFTDFEMGNTTTVLQLASDATLNPKLGIGGQFLRPMRDNNDGVERLTMSWFCQRWPAGFIAKSECSIEVAELLGSCMAVTMWAQELSGKRVTIWCDNQAVVHMINKSTSSCRKCMFLLRHLTLLCMTYSCRIFCRYISTEDNYLSDLLSRQKIPRFLELAKQQAEVVDQLQTPLPSNLWPIPDPLWK